MSTYPAVRAAIELHQIPSRVSGARNRPLPNGLSDVLRIVAGETEILEAAAEEMDRPADEILAASKFFVEQIMMAPDADSYRVLGATSETDTNELRQNMALLMRWLHPDTGTTSMRAVFAHRVTEAWDTLKTPDRRSAYDATRSDDASAEDHPEAARGWSEAARQTWTSNKPPRPPSPRAVRQSAPIVSLRPRPRPPRLLDRVLGWFRR